MRFTEVYWITEWGLLRYTISEMVSLSTLTSTYSLFSSSLSFPLPFFLPPFRGKVKRVVGQFTPYSWTHYRWGYFGSFKRFSFVCLIVIFVRAVLCVCVFVFKMYLYLRCLVEINGRRQLWWPDVKMAHIQYLIATPIHSCSNAMLGCLLPYFRFLLLYI